MYHNVEPLEFKGEPSGDLFKAFWHDEARVRLRRRVATASTAAFYAWGD